MGAFLLAAKLFGGKLWSIVSHLKFWQLVSIGLLLWSLLLLYQRNDARHDRDSYKTQRDYYVGELKRITSARDEQRETTERNVEKVVKGDPNVREIVRVIHDAPNPEGCRTPGLETLRQVL